MHGQAAVEMLAYAIFFLMIFVVIVSVFFQTQAQEMTRAENAFAQEVANGFADNIRIAYIAGPGFSQTVTLPQYIQNKQYTLTISKNPNPGQSETGFVYVDWRGQMQPMSFAATTITTQYSQTTDATCISTPAGTDYIVVNVSASPTCQKLNMSNINGVIRITKG